MNDQKFFDRCAQKLSGALSPEQESKFSIDLEKDPERKEAYHAFEKQWETSGKLKLRYEANPQLAWEKFSELKFDHKPITVRWIHFATRLAAMVLLTIGLGFLIREFGKTEPYHYATFEGETKWVVLPDSSRIKLNESTLLTVASDFNAKERNVSLKGEAFFEISRDESKPFIIHAEGARTQVLGTSFNIRAVEEEPKVEIYVISGKVSFAANEAELILTHGMAANFDKSLDLLALETNQDNALAWHSNALVFKDSPLHQVFADLQDYFEVEIFIANDNIKNCRFTGEFKKPKLEEILKVIAITTGTTHTENKNGYTIQGEGCSPAQ
ncbi:FecR family protein [Reichenbachiella sp.]|uniref:FecR family protein n=1 Tax=Reichenbachiella sp. TaxID=2184521 RepID=UPI003B5BF69A